MKSTSGAGAGTGPGRREATHKEEEVENEEEVLDEAEAALLRRHLHLERRATSWMDPTEVLAAGRQAE